MNPATGTFITQDTSAGAIFDPTSLHKYLYANANSVMYIDPSGYSAENDISFYQQAWITIDQAIEYEHKLLGSISNKVAYDYNVMQIGREIIHQLRNTGLEYALTYVLEPYVGPDVARLIANGVVSGLDMALSSRNKDIGDKLGISSESNSSDDYITVYRGTNMSNEITIADETGYIMSDSMRANFNNGINISDAFICADKIKNYLM